MSLSVFEFVSVSVFTFKFVSTGSWFSTCPLANRKLTCHPAVPMPPEIIHMASAYSTPIVTESWRVRIRASHWMDATGLDLSFYTCDKYLTQN